MLINIVAPTGGNKTKTALEIIAKLGMEKGHKVIYICPETEFDGYKPYLEDFVGKDSLKYFRPTYAETFADAMQILPWVEHWPYDMVVFDGYFEHFEPQILAENTYENISQYLKPDGIVIITSNSSN